jgi:hypothetical protein
MPMRLRNVALRRRRALNTACSARLLPVFLCAFYMHIEMLWRKTGCIILLCDPRSCLTFTQRDISHLTATYFTLLKQI